MAVPSTEADDAERQALWRWASEASVVHLVSRSLPSGLTLQDAVLARAHLRGRSEDEVLAADPSLCLRLRRGLTFAVTGSPAAPGVKVELLRRGLPKFFDLDLDALAEALSGTGPPEGARSAAERVRASIAGALASRVREALGAAHFVRIFRLAKANGENAQVAFFPAAKQWVLCSKNVSLLAASREDLASKQWADHRYRFARVVADVWLRQVEVLPEGSRAELRQLLAEHSLVGELLGGASHLVAHRGCPELRWFALVPKIGDEPCLPPARTLEILRRHGLPCVPAAALGPELGLATVDEVNATLTEAVRSMETAQLAEEGEGCVLYFVSRTKEGSERTLGLCKVKTAEYRLMRKLREKAKHFARGGGSIAAEAVVASYRTEASELRAANAAAVEKYAGLLGRLCRYIYSEDVPPQDVDERFLDILEKARDSEGLGAPSRPGPVVCLLVPPLLAPPAALLAGAIQEAVPPVSLARLGPAAAWHMSTTGRPVACSDVVPALLEQALSSKRAAPPEPAVDSGRKRRRKGTAEGRKDLAIGRVAEELKRRCLFALYGWSEEGCARSLQLAAAGLLSQLDATQANLLPRELGHFINGGDVLRRAMLGKWREQADHLRTLLPSSQTVWLPTLGADHAEAVSAIAAGLHALGSGPVGGGARVTVVLPVGLPGMGKSTLLERLFARCRALARRSFRQGEPLEDKECWAQAESPAETLELDAVAMLSSDAFAAAELEPGSTAEDEDDMAACRRRGAEAYRDAIADFWAFVAEDMARQQGDGPAGPSSTGGRTHRYVLLLDKNHPPAAVQQEAESLADAAPFGCKVHIKALVLQGLDEVPPPDTSLEGDEMRQFGPWRYPWSPEVVAECAARLLKRTSHETLVDGDTALFVLLSFLRLYEGHDLLAAAPGVEAAQAPCIPVLGDLAYLAGLYGSCVTAAAVPSQMQQHRRFEVRALLRQALAAVRPFGGAEASAGQVAALRACLEAASGPGPQEAVVQCHADSLARDLMPALLAPTGGAAMAPPPAPLVRYAALSVEAHHASLEAFLQSACSALVASCPGAGEPFPESLYEAPDLLHVTTAFFGGAVQPSEEQRRLLVASKRLLRAGATFDCAVTEVVCARGALALAVVARDELLSSSAPLDGRQPHITLRCRPPWRPKQANDVLDALQRRMEEDASPPLQPGEGRWHHRLRVLGGVLDVFTFRPATPLALPRCPLLLK